MLESNLLALKLDEKLRNAILTITDVPVIYAWRIYSAKKLETAVKEMKRLNMDIEGISETKWPNATIYYSQAEETDTYHRNGIPRATNLRLCTELHKNIGKPGKSG